MGQTRRGQPEMSCKARKAVQFAKSVTKNADPVKRADAARALGKMKSAESAEHVLALAQAVNDPHEKVRWRAVEALGRFNPSETAPDVIATAQAAIAGALADEVTHVRSMAAQAFTKLPCSPLHADALAEAMLDGEDMVALYAAHALGNMGPAAAGYVSLIADAVEDDDYRCIRYALIQALGNIGPASSAYAGMLVAVLKEGVGCLKNNSNRQCAAEALRKMGDAVMQYSEELADIAEKEIDDRVRRSLKKMTPLLEKAQHMVDKSTIQNICLCFGPQARSRPGIWEQGVLSCLLVSKSPEKKEQFMTMFREKIGANK